MKKLSLVIAAVVVSLFVFPAPSKAGVVVYTDLTSWQTALSGSSIFLEDFSGATLSAPGLSVVSTVGVISGGLWSDRVVNGGANTTWTFDGGAIGFGGNWDLSPGGQGQGIKFTLNLVGGGSVLVGTEVPRSSTGEFFGFVSTDAFTSVFYDGGTQSGVAETHTLDNLQFAPVPEPATFGLMGLAMAGLSAAAYRKSRRRV